MTVLNMEIKIKLAFPVKSNNQRSGDKIMEEVWRLFKWKN